MTTAIAHCIAFVPLSNWLRGFDRYRVAYSKRLLPLSSYPDGFFVFQEHEDTQAGRRKVMGLMERMGISGDRMVALHARLPVGEGALVPNTHTGTGIGWRWPHGNLPLDGVSWAGADGSLQPVTHEVITAQAYSLALSDLYAWEECSPRSFSVLPVTMACNARCAFCFSKASVSTLQNQKPVHLDDVARWADEAKRRGAERAVITGGGEPTLLKPNDLDDLVETLGKRFSRVILITNGSRLTAQPGETQERLARLTQKGLTCLALSRHGETPEQDAQLLGLAVDTQRLMSAVARTPGLHARNICVLQKQGISSKEGIFRYLSRCAKQGVSDVCFKELYVSSLSENQWAPSAENTFARSNQVSLHLAIDALRELGFEKAGELPWGSPYFSGVVDGVRMSVATYTEPSVGWERHHGMVRSWNLYPEGLCLASLEDPASRVHLQHPDAG